MNILAISYAFPPLQVPMSYVVYKYINSLKQASTNVDIITIDYSTLPSNYKFHYDNALDVDITTNFKKIHKLQLKRNLYNDHIYDKYLIDPMDIFRDELQNFLQYLDLSSYDAVITFSPFHSINMALVALKKLQSFKWIIHFCDPWYGNPLETQNLRRVYSYFKEKQVLLCADGIVCTNSAHLDFILRTHNFTNHKNTTIIPHTFLQSLYPTEKEPKVSEKLIIRYIGTLFKHRKPNVLFKAIRKLSESFPNIRHYISIELIGSYNANTISSLDEFDIQDICKFRPYVNYLESLKLMYNADILLLIDENKHSLNLFFPSKLADYIGSSNCILGIVNEGTAKDILNTIGYPCVNADDVDGLTETLGKLISKQPIPKFDSKIDFLRSDVIGNNYINYIKSL